MQVTKLKLGCLDQTCRELNWWNGAQIKAGDYNLGDILGQFNTHKSGAWINRVCVQHCKINWLNDRHFATKKTSPCQRSNHILRQHVKGVRTNSGSLECTEKG